MQTRKRASPAGKKESGEGERKRWASPRKRQKTDYDLIQEDSDSVEEDKSSEELLHSQEHCIKSEERWFSPCGFEEFGGKGTHKKWKNSIIYKNQPLHFWIDRGYLNPPPIKRRTSAASEPSNTKKCHPEESVDKSDHEDVGPDEPTETSEEQPKVQNGEKTNDFTIDIVSIVSQRKPILILHRLELQGDFHLLLNNVVLPQNGSRCMPMEEQSEEKIELCQDDSPGPVETSEPQEETLLHNTNNENEGQDEVESIHAEDTVTIKDHAIGTSPEKGIMNVKNEVEIETSSFQINMELEEEEADTPLNEIIPDSALQVLDEGSLQEDNPVTVLSDPPTTAHTSIEENDMEEATPLDVIIPESALLIERPSPEDNPVTVLSDPPTTTAHTSIEENDMEEATPLDVIISDSALLIERPSPEDNTVTVLCDPPTTAHTNAEEDVIEEGTPLDVIIPDLALQALIERSPIEDNHVTVLSDPPATTAHTSAEEDVIDLDELKRQKIKWQIKVLKLQEQYYSLQIQKLKQ